MEIFSSELAMLVALVSLIVALVSGVGFEACFRAACLSNLIYISFKAYQITSWLKSLWHNFEAIRTTLSEIEIRLMYSNFAGHELVRVLRKMMMVMVMMMMMMMMMMVMVMVMVMMMMMMLMFFFSPTCEL